MVISRGSLEKGLILLLLPTFILSTSLLSCTKNRKTPSTEETTKTATSEKNINTSRLEANARKRITLKEKGNNTVESNNKKLKTTTGKSTPDLIKTDQGNFVYPIDFKIGSLQGVLESGKNRQIIRTAESFLYKFEDGQIDENLIFSDVREELADILKYHISQKHLPISFRIGRINPKEDGKAMVNIRLFSKVGSSEGEIYLKQRNNNWYITGIQLDFNELSVKKNEKKEKFNPSPYSWMLKGL